MASHLLLQQQESILLLRRYRTGWEDGKYSVVAGHVDPGESAVEALLREAWEEAGIRIEAEHLEFAHVMHRRKEDGEEKLDVWFSCEKWDGVLHNAEPHMCDDLRWFSWESLPTNMVDYVRTALCLIREGYKFSVYHGQGLLHFSGADSRVKHASALPQYL
ncbi:MAG: NUDIX domain-containing protein [Chitinophagaceae bacterium]